MKFNLNNPAFLQAASNVGGEMPVTRFVFVEGKNQVKLSSRGKVIIESVQGGDIVRETYGALNDTIVTINADGGSEVVIYGAVTILSNNVNYPQNIFLSINVSENIALTGLYCDNCEGLTSLDVSKNIALTDLGCTSCMGLTSIDVSKNIALTYLGLSRCKGLTSIIGIAVNSNVSAGIATAITDATSVDGTVTLRQGDEFNQTIIDAAMEKGWDVQYYQ